MNELALFAGGGGGLLGSKLLGWRTLCAVEIDRYARSILLARQRDGHLERFPIWDDIKTFDGNQWRGHVDIVTGGFPCQDISAAGKGKGLAGERSGLWSEMARVIGEVQPSFVLVENSPMLRSRGLDRVLADLAALGFHAEWDLFSAAYVGAPHVRQRIWIAAYADCARQQSAVDTSSRSASQKRNSIGNLQPEIRSREASWNGAWSADAGIPRVADGLASGMVKQLKASGNGQVPLVVQRAWTELSARFKTTSTLVEASGGC